MAVIGVNRARVLHSTVGRKKKLPIAPVGLLIITFFFDLGFVVVAFVRLVTPVQEAHIKDSFYQTTDKLSSILHCAISRTYEQRLEPGFGFH